MEQLNSQQIQMLSQSMLPGTNRFLLGLLSNSFITGQVEMRIGQQTYTPMEACLFRIARQIKETLK